VAEARQDFERIPVGSPLEMKAREAILGASRGPTIPLKSMGLAAGLNAILPGAGYAYANRPQTAAACFVVNGLFIWGTVASVHAKEPGLAALLSLFSLAGIGVVCTAPHSPPKEENQSRLSTLIEPLELFR